ncbi:solute carrier family 35 member G1 isoform X2 [Eurytemora carolleeae]|uniref:solute carrier family 35 member G1 isoform X2 n=1 Tax=Eurytemora carolleeae TaxID=1294199 RepID=UPI000C770757|nr:solute carrier family 35 member G1 isoform X2 [Eurytemora carolleeae]|eukprot:XP_023342131.1 solute carrier family 35 member G1-like isoform X2 [Eurytemora affinis]
MPPVTGPFMVQNWPLSSPVHDEEEVDVNSRLLPVINPDSLDKNSNQTTLKMSTVDAEASGKVRFLQGVFLSTLSGVLFTANNFIIKYFKVLPCDAVLVRGLVQVLLLFIFSCSKRYNLIPDNLKVFSFVVLQSVFGAFSFITALICVSLMPVADALVIMFTDPLVTMVVAAIFLGERLNILRVTMGLSILTGVTLVCKPPFLFPSDQDPSSNGTSGDLLDAINALMHSKVMDLDDGTPEVVHDTAYWTGAGFAMAAVLCGTFHNITVPACKDIKSTVLVLYVGLMAIVISAVGAQFEYLDSKMATGKAKGQISEIELEMWGILFGLAISGMIAYLSLTRALQIVSPTIVSSLRALEIVFAYIAESLIFSILPSALSVVGGGIVVFSVVGIALEGNILRFWRNLRSSRTRIQVYEEL